VSAFPKNRSAWSRKSAVNGSPTRTAYRNAMPMQRVTPLFALQVPDPTVVRYPAQLVARNTSGVAKTDLQTRHRRTGVDVCNGLSLMTLKLGSPKRGVAADPASCCASPIAKAHTNRGMLAPVRGRPLEDRARPGALPRRSRLQIKPLGTTSIRAAPPNRLTPLRHNITSSGLLTGVSAVGRRVPRARSAPLAQNRQPGTSPLYCC